MLNNFNKKMEEEFDNNFIIKSKYINPVTGKITHCSCYRNLNSKCADVNNSHIKSFIKQNNSLLLEEVVKWANRKIQIHQKIINTHEVSPKDWHQGNIQALTDLITKFNKEL